MNQLEIYLVAKKKILLEAFIKFITLQLMVLKSCYLPLSITLIILTKCGDLCFPKIFLDKLLWYI